MRKIIFWNTIILVGMLICITGPLGSGSLVGVQTAGAQWLPLSQLKSGPNNAITDVPGIKVGHITDVANYTGVTVVLVDKTVANKGATPGAEIRGGCPGTISVDILDPDKCFDKVFGISLAGGSCYGYAANIGLRQYCMEHKLGIDIVEAAPGAIIFDLGRFGKADWKKTPTYQMGYDAAANAKGGPVEQGNIGGGMGAISGGVKGGVGTASMDLGNGVMVGAIVVNNSAGSAFDPETAEFWARHLEIIDARTGKPEFSSKYGLKTAAVIKPGGSSYAMYRDLRKILKTQATAIGVVATNIDLNKSQTKRVAIMAMDGHAKAIRPSATYFDGDSLFVLATGTLPLSALGEDWMWGEASGNISTIGLAAADCYARAFIHSLLNTYSIGDVKSYYDIYRRKAYRMIPPPPKVKKTD